MLRIDLTGMSFGMLKVITPSCAKNGRTTWLCICKCGNHKVISTENLQRNHARSCGCLNDKRRGERAKNMYSVNIKYHPRETSARKIWRQRYSDGDLSFDEFYNISQENCYYCDSEPTNKANAALDDKKSSKYAKENGDFLYNGLDRLDSSFPHMKNNVVPCCKWCNYAKRSSHHG